MGASAPGSTLEQTIKNAEYFRVERAAGGESIEYVVRIEQRPPRVASKVSECIRVCRSIGLKVVLLENVLRGVLIEGTAIHSRQVLKII